jgi:acyl-coenzyme A synthetase/AMP-(fatty) acid ligase/3-hydroxymyristoyl/3-hydroxydecanoyl-(acyl carrier protein) dehydratase
MSWIDLENLLLEADPNRQVSMQLNHAQLCQYALTLGGHWRASGIQRMALYLPDADELAIALLAAWQAGIHVLLPADDRPRTRQRLNAQADIWLDTLDRQPQATPLRARRLDPERCCLSLLTSGSSGEPKLIDKRLYQLSNEARALEQLWGNRLADAVIIGSVSAQHIYGLLFRVLWPLSAGRVFLSQAQPFPEDLQIASLPHKHFAWVTSPALLKRMGDNLDWSALSRVCQVFSSGGALPLAAAHSTLNRLGRWPTEIYGSSETGGIAWREGEAPWQPFADVQLQVDASGVLRLSSAYLPSGHWEPLADEAHMVAGGRFILGTRLDRIVKLEEKRVSLPQLEQALSQHAWVNEARLGVVQQGRAFLGALVALSAEGLHVLRNNGRRHLTEGLRQHLAPQCDRIALPRRWRLLTHLPYTHQGKLSQAQVHALLTTKRPTRIAPSHVQETAGEWHLQLEIPPDLAFFSGHFPGTPILPGVVQVDWAEQFARELIRDLPELFAGMEVLKFQQLIRPGDRLQLTLRFDRERDKLHFNFRNGQHHCSSGRILLRASA